MPITMAPDWPSGIWPGEGIGGDSAFKQHEYPIMAAYNTVIPSGALVIINQSTGGVEAYGTGAHGGDVIGVSVHKVAAIAEDTVIMVYDDPNQIFEAQLSATTDDTLAEIVGQFYAINGNATEGAFGRSIAELTDGGATYSTSVFCMAIGIARAVDNVLDAATAQRTRVRFKIANAAHRLAAGVS